MIREVVHQPTIYWENVYEPNDVILGKQCLTASEAHVWITSTEASLFSNSHLYNLLSAEEKKRARNFKFARDQNQFVVSHGILRLIIAAYTRHAPNELRYEYTKYGKPFLFNQSEEKEIHFNMTHSKDAVSYIVSTKDEVGIDMEQVKCDLDWYNIAKQYFSSSELIELESVESHEQSNAFYLMWTRKEAMLKALGVGLSGLRELDEVLQSRSKCKHTLVSFMSDRNLQCSIAVSPSIIKIKYFRYITNTN
ncbi:4'-phosphopantetheinyl transferase [Paenibacillus sp. yr247]|uniref:4'-phosphopantetheinyl transferase family protein n=1 Tax=Paenibacillus sp. yr247 TaxID=1761880 RepID=UPI00088FC245|nr:4'-phosphopantetheinyl transferase superfamily protein [Paenibacillus sp. yr247]SDN32258.1 4'-phosphopantetheinyl transferase [Paenibacillus sp. yr247]